MRRVHHFVQLSIIGVALILLAFASLRNFGGNPDFDERPRLLRPTLVAANAPSIAFDSPPPVPPPPKPDARFPYHGASVTQIQQRRPQKAAMFQIPLLVPLKASERDHVETQRHEHKISKKKNSIRVKRSEKAEAERLTGSQRLRHAPEKKAKKAARKPRRLLATKNAASR